MNQRGDSRITLVLTLVIVAYAIFAATKIIPVRVASYEFADYLREEAQKAAWTRDEKVLRAHILEKARLLELPVTDKNLKIEFAGGDIRVSADYQIPVDLKLTTWVMQFSPRERAPLF